MHIEAVTSSSKMAVGYLVYDHAGGSGAIIDAPMGSTPWYIDALHRSNVDLLYIINTHGHWDLIADNAPLIAATHAPLCAHSWDTARLADPKIGVEDLTEKVPSIPASRPDVYLADGMALQVGNLTLTVIYTPGHTPGSICIYEPDSHTLFTGDTLGRHYAGNTNFPGGNQEHLHNSLIKLAALPDNTHIYPSHGPTTTIREERWLLELAAAG